MVCQRQSILGCRLGLSPALSYLLHCSRHCVNAWTRGNGQSRQNHNRNLVLKSRVTRFLVVHQHHRGLSIDHRGLPTPGRIFQRPPSAPLRLRPLRHPSDLSTKRGLWLSRAVKRQPPLRYRRTLARVSIGLGKAQVVPELSPSTTTLSLISRLKQTTRFIVRKEAKQVHRSKKLSRQYQNSHQYPPERARLYRSSQN